MLSRLGLGLGISIPSLVAAEIADNQLSLITPKLPFIIFNKNDSFVDEVFMEPLVLTYMRMAALLVSVESAS